MKAAATIENLDLRRPEHDSSYVHKFSLGRATFVETRFVTPSNDTLILCVKVRLVGEVLELWTGPNEIFSGAALEMNVKGDLAYVIKKSYGIDP